MPTVFAQAYLRPHWKPELFHLKRMIYLLVSPIMFYLCNPQGEPSNFQLVVISELYRVIRETVSIRSEFGVPL